MPKGLLRRPKNVRCDECGAGYQWFNTGKISPWCPDCRPTQLRKKRVEITQRYVARNGQKVLQWRQERARRTNRQKRYGLPESEFERLGAEQGGKCAICGTVPPRLHVDHHHGTGDIRALLCFHCNAGLGHFKDDPELMRLAADYLGREPAIVLRPAV